MWDNTDQREDDSAGFANQAPPLVMIVLALLLVGFWTAAYQIYLELVAAGVLP